MLNKSPCNVNVLSVNQEGLGDWKNLNLQGLQSLGYRY